MKQKITVIDPLYLLTLARDRWPKTKDLVKHTCLSRTTIWRIESRRFVTDTISISKLVKALNS